MDELNYEKFMMYLRKFQNKIQKEINEDLKAFHISSTYMNIIMALASYPPGYSMSELSRIISVDNALMTRNIKELEKIDYIYRNRENDSQRKYHICLTEKGMEVAKELKQIAEKRKEEFQKNFTKEEQKVIEEGMQIIIHKFMNTIEKEEKEC